MPLTDKEIWGLKPTGKKFKVFDGDGLYILVHPEGGKYRYMKYQWGGRPQGIVYETYGREPKTGSQASRRSASAAGPRSEPTLAEEGKKAARQAQTGVFAGGG